MKDAAGCLTLLLVICVCLCVCVAVYSRPGPGEAHGQQHVQSGPMFDGARPGLALLPRCHFGVQFLFRCHNSMLHPYVRYCAPSAYFHLFKREAGWKKRSTNLNPNYLSYAEKRRKHTTLRRNKHFSGFHECFERDQAAS